MELSEMVLKCHHFLAAIVFFFLVWESSASPVLQAGAGLPKLHIEVGNLSISGVSSGAFFATQLEVAHSSKFMGAGIIAGGPFWCAQDAIPVALSSCTKDPELIVLDELYSATTLAESVLSIDPTSNLKTHRVWIFSGTKDTEVHPGVVEKAAAYYQHYIPGGGQVVFVNTIPAEHSWVTNSFGSPCPTFASPFINNCDYDSAGKLLQHIYSTTLNPPATALTGQFLQFDQGQYTPLNVDPGTLSLNDVGVAYIPSNCQQGSLCKLHVAFHGCLQYMAAIGNDFVLHTGLNEWAETNNMVILYPQTVNRTVPLNPKGCWNWWGYGAEADYATKLAPQIVTVMNMVEAIAGTL